MDKIKKEKKPSSTDFFVWSEEHIKAKFHNPDNIGNYYHYQTAIKKLKEFVGADTLRPTRIDEDFVAGYHKWLKSKHDRETTVWSYFKFFKALFNAAKKGKERIIAKDKFPFSDEVVPRGKRTEIKARLTLQELDKIRALEYEVFSDLWMARAIFLLQFNIRGVRVKDILVLEEHHISDGRFRKITSKDKESINVKLTLEAQEIIDTIIKEKRKRNIKSPFLIPLVKDGTPLSLYRRVGSALAMVNRSLKVVAINSKIKAKLSSHVSRTTWAQIGLNEGLSMRDLQKGLGHSSLAMTEMYLADLDQSALDKINDLVTKQ